MRIALLHFTAAPVIGGVERVMAEHEELLRGDGHEVTVIAGADLQVQSLEEALREEQIVIAHNLLTMPFRPEITRELWRLAAQSGGQRFIAWTHDVAAANPSYKSAVDAAPELFRACSPHFEYVAVSERRRQELHKTMRLPLERCTVIPNGIAPLDHWRVPERWHHFIREARLLERDLVLLHPARLVRRKMIQTSLEIVAVLRAAGTDAALLITAPDDPHQPVGAAYLAELRARRLELALEGHAFFAGDFGQPPEADDVAAFYEMADAILFPSTQEGFGLPMLEAALHRVPIFCHRIEPLMELPAAPTAFFDAEASPAAMAAHIMRALEAFPTMNVRKQVVRGYGWPAIHGNCIAPYLRPKQTHPRP